ncbi:MAG TPA: DNA primase, partial [Microbacterium sp.]|nr:DNA primase [Microbacterium sp.]
RHEPLEPFRERQNGGELDASRERLAAWARTASKAIGAPWPDMPDGIADRDADVWESLIAIAEAAGGDWPKAARSAALVLVRDAHERPASLGIRLLGDVRRILDRLGVDRVRSIELLHELIGLEDGPWGDLGGKGAIDSRFLGRTFDGYGIPAAHAIRFGPSIGVAKGWHRVDFADPWDRYLPEQPSPTVLTDKKSTKKEKK